jgi:hypothetical protein
VSPDAGVIRQTIERVRRHAVVVIAGESAAIGAAIAAWSVPTGLIVALLFALWRSRAASRRAIVRAIEHANPDLRNLLVTADELESGALTSTRNVHDRVLHDAAMAVRSVQPRRVVSMRRLAWLAIVSLVAWATAAALDARRPFRTTASASSSRTTSTSDSDLKVTVTIEPPDYTGLARSVVREPVTIDVVENSHLRFDVEAAAQPVSIEIDEKVQPLTRNADGVYEYQATATRSGYALVAAAGRTRMMPIDVTPDALPSVRLRKPGRDLVYASGDATIAFDAEATDDFGLRSLALRFTKVSGSGEQFEFADGEVALSLEKANARAWTGRASRSLKDLGLAEGDMLVYRAVATDARPGAPEASSDAFFIQISSLGAAAGDAFTLPEEETRYALSQQMLIVKTGRLNDRRGSMAAAEFANAAQELAVEQRMIRSEFVFMLGGEIQDEEVEAQQSTELQEGRLANRGQRDLRAATVAMSQAEKLLTAADTKNALEAERAAVNALQRAFTRDRYILRALASRSQLDSSRRLTGAFSQASGWQRRLPEAPENRRAAHLQSLLEGLSELEHGRGRPDQDVKSALVVLARTAIRTDAQSDRLRQIAATFQDLADAWSSLGADQRAQRLGEIGRAIGDEARSVLSDPPVTFGHER